MWRGQIIGNSWLCARRNRQSEAQRPLPDEPYACLSRLAAKEFKPRDVGQRQSRRNLRYMFTLQYRHQFHARVCQFAKKSGRLLPLTLARDVAVVAAPES